MLSDVMLSEQTAYADRDTPRRRLLRMLVPRRCCRRRGLVLPSALMFIYRVYGSSSFRPSYCAAPRENTNLGNITAHGSLTCTREACGFTGLDGSSKGETRRINYACVRETAMECRYVICCRLNSSSGNRDPGKFRGGIYSIPFDPLRPAFMAESCV